ncbi:TetR/AcrR family transcriptional regulator [Amycolatopsis ultiminotia]|uniref:TetR/AcrR family transcriptional regulator n=1 Tax=Amycolatopsis ultiminotia TaxID=543629 RepID=A0ABP6V3W1_9PSEU
MERNSLNQRRRSQTRLEIATAALALFVRHGYDAVGLDAVAEEAGVSLRTLYRYFPTKDELLSPIVATGTARLADRLAERPAGEPLVEAVERAYDTSSICAGPENVHVLIDLLITVPALRARWLDDLRTVEEALAPVIQDRAHGDLDEDQARCTAAVIVTALRLVLERSARPGSNLSLSAELGHTLHYLRAGAHL